MLQSAAGLSLPGAIQRCARHPGRPLPPPPRWAGSAPAPGVRVGDLPFRAFTLSPPYEEPVYHSPVSTLDAAALAGGTVLGLDVPQAAACWREVQQAGAMLRARLPLVPLAILVEARPADLLHCGLHAPQTPIRVVLMRGEPVAAQLRQQLTRPTRLGEDVVDWLLLRGLRLQPTLAHQIAQIFTRAPEHHEISSLLRATRTPESSTRFRFHKKGLPSPSRWLQAARAVHAAMRLQAAPHRPLLAVAFDLGYADHSALCHQLYRTFGLRSSSLRSALGWEWLLDRWLRLHGRAPAARPVA